MTVPRPRGGENKSMDDNHCPLSKHSFDPPTLSILQIPNSRTMPSFSRRQKEPHMIHSDVEVVGLSRVDTISTVDSLATIGNQPGAGRTVGLLLTSLGSKLEGVINKRAERLNSGSNALALTLARNNTVSSIDTNATIDDQPGAGRTVGRFLASLGSDLESVLNKSAERSGSGPKAVADQIRRCAGHRQIWIARVVQGASEVYDFGYYLPVAPGRRFNSSETRTLRKLCQKLIGHARSLVKGTQLIALEELDDLAMKDPRIRLILTNCDLNRIITHYEEPDLLSSTVKALGVVEFSNVHRIWAPILSLQITKTGKDFKTYDLSESLKEEAFKALRNPSTSFLSARYFQGVLGDASVENYGIRFPQELLEDFMHEFRNNYAKVASQDPNCIEWSTFVLCTNRQSWGTTHDKVGILFENVLDMATTLKLRDTFIHCLSFILVKLFPLPQDINLFNNPVFDGFIEILTSEVDQRNLAKLLYYISDNLRSSLKGTIFIDKVISLGYLLHCHTANNTNVPRFVEINTLKNMFIPLVYWMRSCYWKDRWLATALSARLCRTSRYCKQAALWAAQEASVNLYPYLSPINRIEFDFNSQSFPDSLYRVCHSDFVGLLAVGIKVNFNDQFKSNNEERFQEAEAKRDICMLQQQIHGLIYVDKMDLHGDNDAMWMTVDGDDKPFCSTGHYPILLFQSEEEPPQSVYIARVVDESGIYHTFVEEGASFVTYQRKELDDESAARARRSWEIDNSYGWGGVAYVTYESINDKSEVVIKFTEERTSKFEVLVLRYDPVDYRSKLRDGELKDPTGPLGWKNIYTAPEVSFADCLGWFS
ncbi:hypothetical protein SCHPADRAFT_989216 [Schizopora paradoxa]|uniref:Uncharacterized protein n=1 Tax=Schizopora paradoxa TaxID=27342 RepID=A0A0H2R634_9AGAM|nr:hypothetical protein SCHPADRAFT_989216 [Schizopora paradoxa]